MQTYYKSDSGRTYFTESEAKLDEELHYQTQLVMDELSVHLFVIPGEFNLRSHIYNVLYELLQKGKIKTT